jgi:putative membrane protein
VTAAPGLPPRPHPLRTLAVGAAMGAADVVPGFSGGTVALVAGVYDRLIAAVSGAAGLVPVVLRGRWREVPAALRALDAPFLLTLLAGLAAAAATLAGPLERLLEEQPVVMSALFLGLVLGAAVVARHRLRAPAAQHAALVVGAAVVTAAALGLRPAGVADPGLAFLALAGAIGVSAMILPGISGSFLLLLLGAYEPVIAAIAARDLSTLAVFGAGIVTGLALFARLLDRLLRRHHDTVLALLIGLMVGSARVLWPWPAGAGIGDPALGPPGAQAGVAALVGLGALAAVVGIEAVARRATARTTRAASAG